MKMVKTKQVQKREQYYCKVEKSMRMFVNHADHKNLWICTSCRFTTSNPKNKLPKATMENVYEEAYKILLEKRALSRMV